MPQILSELKKLADPEKAGILQRFFKTGKGEYGEGDVFLGVTVPKTRSVAKKFVHLSLVELKKSLSSKFHEERLCAFLILVEKFAKADEEEREEIFNFYIANARFANNWDLVDLSAPKIVGEYLLEKPKKILYEFAKSKNLWERRIAVVSTYTFIKSNSLSDTFAISEILLNDSHDLIHKACGWMLREAGKKDKKALTEFLGKHRAEMPRTMLRYAIEKFPEKERKAILKGSFP